MKISEILHKAASIAEEKNYHSGAIYIMSCEAAGDIGEHAFNYVSGMAGVGASVPNAATMKILALSFAAYLAESEGI